MDNNNMKNKRLNLWKRLKPEYKKAIKKDNKDRKYKLRCIKDELRLKFYFTDVTYGTAYDVMRPNSLDFLGDAFNIGNND